MLLFYSRSMRVPRNHHLPSTPRFKQKPATPCANCAHVAFGLRHYTSTFPFAILPSSGRTAGFSPGVHHTTFLSRRSAHTPIQPQTRIAPRQRIVNGQSAGILPPRRSLPSADETTVDLPSRHPSPQNSAAYHLSRHVHLFAFTLIPSYQASDCRLFAPSCPLTIVWRTHYCVYDAHSHILDYGQYVPT